MLNKLAATVAGLALASSSLLAAGSASAECNWGNVTSANYNGPGTYVYSSTQKYGNVFTARGWNDTPWGFRWSYSNIERTDGACNIGGIYGAIVTSELRPDGTNTTVTTPYTLGCGWFWHGAYQSGNLAINHSKIQIWACY